MKDKTSDELLTIWQENDMETWSDEAFEAVKAILMQRLVSLPQAGQRANVIHDRVLRPPLHSSMKKMFGIIFILVGAVGFLWGLYGVPGDSGHLRVILFSGVILFGVGLKLLGARKRTPLHDAAMQGDVSRVDDYIRKGFPVNKQDSVGNTPLHYAYYHFQKEAIDRLKTYGADLTTRNKDGDTPLDMHKIAHAEILLTCGARLLSMSGEWTDRRAARPIYDKLKGMDVSIASKAIVRSVVRGEDRLRSLSIAVKLGRPGSEDRLNDALQGYGDKSMAEDYLNSGSLSLYEGAKRWANSRGYNIRSGMGSHRVGWGKF